MLDAQLIFSSAQPITASAPSTNVIDMLVARDIGVGNMLEINVYTTTLFVGVGATMQIVLQGSNVAGGAGAYNDILMTAVIATAALIAGQHLFAVPLPRLWQPNQQAQGMPRYIRLNYVVAGGPFTGGALNAWLAADLDRNAYYNYPKNYVA
jgi:hypothetical protein